jgi:hypothetical protein
MKVYSEEDSAIFVIRLNVDSIADSENINLFYDDKLLSTGNTESILEGAR